MLIGLCPQQRASAQSEASRLPAFLEVATQFASVSFGAEFGPDPLKGKLWRGTWSEATVGVEGGAAEPVAFILAELSALIGRTIRTARSGEKVNMRVRLNSNRCYVTSDAQGFVVIDIWSGALRHCLLEELAQALGPMNDACAYRPSIFCDPDEITDYAPADRIILRAFFDPRLHNGMTEAEAMPIARVILRELYDAWERGERF